MMRMASSPSRTMMTNDWRKRLGADIRSAMTRSAFSRPPPSRSRRSESSAGVAPPAARVRKAAKAASRSDGQTGIPGPHRPLDLLESHVRVERRGAGGVELARPRQSHRRVELPPDLSEDGDVGLSADARLLVGPDRGQPRRRVVRGSIRRSDGEQDFGISHPRCRGEGAERRRNLAARYRQSQHRGVRRGRPAVLVREPALKGRHRGARQRRW